MTQHNPNNPARTGWHLAELGRFALVRYPQRRVGFAAGNWRCGLRIGRLGIWWDR